MIFSMMQSFDELKNLNPENLEILTEYLKHQNEIKAKFENENKPFPTTKEESELAQTQLSNELETPLELVPKIDDYIEKAESHNSSLSVKSTLVNVFRGLVDWLTWLVKLAFKFIDWLINHGLPIAERLLSFLTNARGCIKQYQKLSQD
ncbi:hypothetical protein XELAEV_18036218mg [Xenopus laevis]|uniref:Uncharacterized protein n=1 Tax=Xenopus laevis TaxID=8355 RepID=A0A974CH26_XENLA|nr:hypothetical protein XELAEV_18036218mg [Xenopus laevis]